MALWDKLKVELDRAGRAAQGAIDESKLRLEAFRARQLADRAAQSLGWAVYHAHVRGEPLSDEARKRMIDALAERDTEVANIEARIRDAAQGAHTPADQPPPAVAPNAAAPNANAATAPRANADAAPDAETENPSPS